MFFLLFALNFVIVLLLFLIFAFVVAQQLVQSSGLVLGEFLRETMTGDSTIRIEKFTGKNSFGLWQNKMKALLKQHLAFFGFKEYYFGVKRQID